MVRTVLIVFFLAAVTALAVAEHGCPFQPEECQAHCSGQNGDCDGRQLWTCGGFFWRECRCGPCIVTSTENSNGSNSTATTAENSSNSTATTAENSSSSNETTTASNNDEEKHEEEPSASLPLFRRRR